MFLYDILSVSVGFGARGAPERRLNLTKFRARFLLRAAHNVTVGHTSFRFKFVRLPTDKTYGEQWWNLPRAAIWRV
jgi:hypothetical protein